MSRRRLRFTDERITMAHGAGGKASRTLVEALIAPAFGLGPDSLGDAASLDVGAGELAFTTDAFVVRPLRFPGGSIGSLAVNGTVNDLAVSGAVPVALSVALVLEEGLATSDLRLELDAMAEAATRAGVRLVTGDTKVVERGAAEGMYVTTAGVGIRRDGVRLDPQRIAVGDRILVSGAIGDHGVAVLLARGDLELEADVRTDTRPLTGVVDALVDVCGEGLRCMRDATRGGVATVACELAMAGDVGIVIDEASVPVHATVAGATEILGIDPLHLANEGVLVAVVAAEVAEAALAAVQAAEGGAEAAIVGEVVDDAPGRVVGLTSFGGRRMIDMLVGDPLPRIC